MNFKNVPLDSKLLFYVIAGTIIVMTFTMGLIISTTTNQHEELTFQQAATLTEKYADQFDSDMRTNMAIARGIASTMKGYEGSERDVASEMVKQTLIDNPNLIATYTGFEPDAFDGMDAEYSNTEYHDETGRFLPYWNSIGGEIFLEPLVHYDSLDYYQEPKHQKRDVLTEPYLYQGELIVSYVSPIIVDEEFIGIGGTDVSLNYIDEEISNIKVLDTGYAYAISNTGMFLTHPSHKDWIGIRTLYDFDDPEIQRMAKDIEGGMNGHIDTIDPVTNKNVIIFYEPVKTGNFSMLLVVPKEEMYAGVVAMQQMLIMISATAILFMGAVAIVSAQSVTKPIKNIVSDFKEISNSALKGKLDTRAKTDIEIDFKDIPEGLNDILDVLKISSDLNDELNKVINSSPVIAFKWKAEEGWPTEFVSENIRKFGYSPSYFTSKKIKYEDIIHPDHKENVRNNIKDMIENKRSKMNVEYKIITAFGDIKWVNERTSLNYNEAGEIDHLSGLIIDITEKKYAETSLLYAKMEAEAANKAKSDFVANMSHELRTPLNAIIGFSDLLGTETFGMLNEKQMRYIDNVSTSGKHLLGLINNILDMSKIEAGKMTLHTEEIDICETIDELNSVIAPLVNKKRIELTHNIDDNIHTTKADKTKFKQIMYNLLSNSIKFTPEEGNIDIKAWMVDSKLHFSVKDSGIGISKDHIGEVFKPFIQVGDFTSKEQAGTGLGLALVKKLVELHGGDIWVESEIGSGSTFTFTMPSSD